MSNYLLRLFVGAKVEAAEERSQSGAEVVQVIMIMGIIAVLVFVLVGKGSVIQNALGDLANKIKGALDSVMN